MKETNYNIYIRKLNLNLPTSRKDFEKYYEEINLFRKRNQYHGLCSCPKKLFVTCDMDCLTCPMRKSGAEISLDAIEGGEDKTERSNAFFQSPENVEDEVLDRLEEQEVIQRILELYPEAIAYGKLKMDGKSDDEIAKILGIPRKTTAYRIEKVKKILQEEFPEYCKAHLPSSRNASKE